tara:strand:- start:70 stop:678 length:609 start_codon:yes stop_codon:yes gene_type:complete
MKIDHQDLEWKLCKTYFSILETKMTSEVSLVQLCTEAKISKKEAEKIVPNNSLDYKYFFLKRLISYLDREVLNELKVDITDDNISSTYDKILEGLSLRFEKYLEFKTSFKILSNNTKQKVQVFFNVFQENYNFTTSLLNLVEGNENCGRKVLKSIALNIIFINGLEAFFKNESNDIDSVIRNLDKFLGDFEDVGLIMGLIKK